MWAPNVCAGGSEAEHDTPRASQSRPLSWANTRDGNPSHPASPAVGALPFPICCHPFRAAHVLSGTYRAVDRGFRWDKIGGKHHHVVALDDV